MNVDQLKYYGKPVSLSMFDLRVKISGSLTLVI